MKATDQPGGLGRFAEAFDLLKLQAKCDPSSLAAKASTSELVVLLCRLVQLERACMDCNKASVCSRKPTFQQIRSALDEYDSAWRAPVENLCNDFAQRKAILHGQGPAPDYSGLRLGVGTEADNMWRQLRSLGLSAQYPWAGRNGGLDPAVPGEGEDVNTAAERNARREAEDLLSKIVPALEGSKVGVWEINSQRGEVWLSDTLLSIQGYSRDEAVAHPDYPELFLAGSVDQPCYLYPGDRDKMARLTQEVLGGTIDVYEVEYRTLHKLGHWVWVEGRGRVVERNSQGMPLRVVGIRTDISARKEAEERLQAARRKADENELVLNAFMKNAPVGMYVKDAEGRYLLANPQMGKVFGCPSGEAIGKTASDLFDQTQAQLIAGRDREVLASGEPNAAIEHMPGLDEFEWSLVMRFPIAGGDTQGMIGGFDIDISQQRRTEARLQAAQLAAQEAQTRALRYQINPHFLFNTLSTIATLVADGEASAAESMILKLARFYRSSLELDPARKIPLGRELHLQSLYLQIESIRFPDQLEVRFDVPEPLSAALVPCLLLQPLIENSVKYGMRSVGHALRIDVIARRKGERLFIHVVDDGRGAPGESGTGLGLELTARRLKTAFHGQHRFKARTRSSGGFQVDMFMPLELEA